MAKSPTDQESFEFGFLNDVGLEIDMDSLGGSMEPAPAQVVAPSAPPNALDYDVIARSDALNSYVQNLLQGAPQHVQPIPAPVPAAAPQPDPSVLQSLTSELVSIRNSINELKRTQGDATFLSSAAAASAEARRSALLSEAITHLANSRGTSAFMDPSSNLLPAGLTLCAPPKAPPAPPAPFDLNLFNRTNSSASAPQQPQPQPQPQQQPREVPRQAVQPAMALDNASVSSLPDTLPTDLLETPDAEPPFQPLEMPEKLEGQTSSEHKRLLRKQRNRQAAHNSRLRKKMRMDSLEDKLELLMDQNRKYRVVCAELTRRNQELEGQLKEVCSSQCTTALNNAANAALINNTARMLPQPADTLQTAQTSEPVIQTQPATLA